MRWVWGEVKKVSSPNIVLRAEVEEVSEGLKKLETRVQRGDSKLTLLEEIESLQKRLMGNLLTGKGVGGTTQFKGLPPEYGELEEIKPLAKSRDKFDQRLAERRYEQVLKKLDLLPED